MCNNESKYLVENVQYRVSINTLLKLPTDLSNHPFNPVIVIPWTKYFDRKSESGGFFQTLSYDVSEDLRSSRKTE